MAAGQAFELKPVGMLALDVARTEAGLLLLDVDYVGSRKALIPAQRYTPFEMGLSRLVSLDKGPFVGRAALAEERRRGPRRQIVGLEIEWAEVEALYEKLGLAPVAPAATSRVPVPVFRRRRQIGRATTTAWSPTLKRLIALATIDAPHHEHGTRVEFEITVEGVQALRRREGRPDAVLQSTAQDRHAAALVANGGDGGKVSVPPFLRVDPLPPTPPLPPPCEGCRRFTRRVDWAAWNSKATPWPSGAGRSIGSVHDRCCAGTPSWRASPAPASSPQASAASPDCRSPTPQSSGLPEWSSSPLAAPRPAWH